MGDEGYNKVFVMNRIHQNFIWLIEFCCLRIREFTVNLKRPRRLGIKFEEFNMLKIGTTITSPLSQQYLNVLIYDLLP